MAFYQERIPSPTPGQYEEVWSFLLFCQFFLQIASQHCALSCCAWSPTHCLPTPAATPVTGRHLFCIIVWGRCGSTNSLFAKFFSILKIATSRPRESPTDSEWFQSAITMPERWQGPFSSLKMKSSPSLWGSHLKLGSQEEKSEVEILTWVTDWGVPSGDTCKEVRRGWRRGHQVKFHKSLIARGTAQSISLRRVCHAWKPGSWAVIHRTTHCWLQVGEA